MSSTAVHTQPLLSGRVAVVTGGAQGIGFAIATALAQQGARLVLADINRPLAEAAANEFRAQGVDAIATLLDVTDETQMDETVALAVTTFGHLDVFVNNAGILRDKMMKSMSLETWREVIDVHLQGCWLGTRAAASVMREQGSGSIVNISSTSGKTGVLGQTNYSAAKAGIVGLTKAAAKEVARFGVRVNAVQPALIRTPMTEGLSDESWKQKVAAIPLQRAGEPSEVGTVVAFLASDLASYVTGSVIEVHGGLHM